MESYSQMQLGWQVMQGDTVVQKHSKFLFVHALAQPKKWSFPLRMEYFYVYPKRFFGLSLAVTSLHF